MNGPSSSPLAWKCRTDLGPELRSMMKERKYRRRGDRLTERQQALASRFLPMARGMAKPLKLMYPYWRDEFESASCLALVEAARSFDPCKNIRFATFARFRIRGALRDVGRAMVLAGWAKDEDQPGVVSLTPYNEEHGKVLVAVEPPPVGEEVDDIDEVEYWFRKLPKRHALVCRLYYLYGKSQAEIAVAFGCSQSEITRLHRKSLDLLSDPYIKPAIKLNVWDQNSGERTFGLAKPKTKTLD